MGPVMRIGIAVIILCSVLTSTESRGVAGNIKLVMMRNNQYWFSTTSPYAPTLNFFLAYEYCRNLGLQLVTLETKEEIEAIALYLTSTEGNSVSGVKEYWTSGNRLGADAWLWMSNGEQMNSSFVVENGLQQRQGVSSVLQSQRGSHCLTMRSMSTRRTIFSPEVCEKTLPFICEQIRCLSYYYPTVEFPDPNQSEFSSGQRSEDTGNDTSPAAGAITR